MIDDTTKEIVYRDYVDISVAVATPKVIQHVKTQNHTFLKGVSPEFET